MIGYLATAFAFGAIKSTIVRGYSHDGGMAHDDIGAAHLAVAALEEETVFRAMPLAALHSIGLSAPFGITAPAFAAAHLHPCAGPARNAQRFVDAGLGGLLYEAAYRSHGLFGAALTHWVHNLACNVGRTK